MITENIQRIVISGAPATGKTSIINAIAQKGFSCHEEFSRTVIRQELERESDVLPWKNLTAFSQAVIQGRLLQFHQASSGLNFYDRSVIDSLAYLRKDQLKIGDNWHDLGKTLRYEKRVFVTPPWQEIFQNDHERRETWPEVLHIHEYLVSTYQMYDYEVVIVPRLTIDLRVDFILENLP